MKAFQHLELNGTMAMFVGMILSKTCCILPLFGFALSGSGLLIDAGKLISPFLMGGSILVLCLSWLKLIKNRRCHCTKKSKRRSSLIVSTIIVGIILVLQIYIPSELNTRKETKIAHDSKTCH